jgi:DNA-binding NarL/FixJ family response regulator
MFTLINLYAYFLTALGQKQLNDALEHPLYSILIIEDDPSYRNVMEVILQMEGFEVRTASGGESGLALLRESSPDLILCDILMTGMDGHAVLEALKGKSTLADIPFIFVSALADRTDVRRGMAAGADDYLPKPFSAEELLVAVTAQIHRHEMITLRLGAATFQEERAVLRHKVTNREREVLLMVGQGATSRDIAQRLGVKLKTVEVHRANLMKKLDAANAACLARWAFIAEQM